MDIFYSIYLHFLIFRGLLCVFCQVHNCPFSANYSCLFILELNNIFNRLDLSQIQLFLILIFALNQWIFIQNVSRYNQISLCDIRACLETVSYVYLISRYGVRVFFLRTPDYCYILFVQIKDVRRSSGINNR